MTLHDSVCAEIRRRRTRSNATQAELAAVAGVPTIKISRIERGTQKIDMNLIQKLAAALGERSTWEFLRACEGDSDES